MPKRDKFDKEQADRRQPTESDPSSTQSDELDLTQELGPDQSAIDAYNMTDPALGDVDRILREVREELGAAEESPEEGAEPSWTEAGSGGEEFRDQEYRDAFDESFERAFQEETEPETAEEFSRPNPARRRKCRKKTAGLRLRKRDPVFSGFLTFSAL